MTKETLHSVTLRAIARKKMSIYELSRLLQCSSEHVREIFSDQVPPNAVELAVLRLCANVQEVRLRSILDDLDHDYEWRPVPGFEKYEVSIYGHIRRSAAGANTLPGKVLTPKVSKTGHLYIKAMSGPLLKTMAVHRAVCAAFNGPSPSPAHVVCHRNDIPHDNRPSNLYWGTLQDNADDRARNIRLRENDTPLTHADFHAPGVSPKAFRKAYKRQMVRNTEARHGNR